jgi:hypothetical protein
MKTHSNYGGQGPEIHYNQRTETKNCAHCGKEFTGHPDRLYCSPRCKRRTPLSREIELTCKQCGLPFMGHPNAMFCSPACKTQFHRPKEECEGFNIHDPWGDRIDKTNILTTPTLEEEEAVFLYYKKYPERPATLVRKPIPGFEDRAPIFMNYIALPNHDAAVMEVKGDYKRLYRKLWNMTPDQRVEAYEKDLQDQIKKINESKYSLKHAKIITKL